MKTNKYFIFAMFVGIQSFLLQLIDQLVGMRITEGGYCGFVFIAFQGWALYFLLGSSLKGAVKGLCGYAMGIVFAVLMMIMASAFSGLGMLAIPVTALIVVPIMMYFEFAPWYISNVSTFFVGAGAFYGIYNYVEKITRVEAAFVVLFYCVLGLGSGFCTIKFRKWYEKELTINEHESVVVDEQIRKTD